MFKHDEMAALIAGVEDKFTSVAGTNNPQFTGKNVLLLEGRLDKGQRAGRRRRHWRTEFLTQMGFTIPDTGGERSPATGWPPSSAAADVLIWTTESDEEQARCWPIPPSAS